MVVAFIMMITACLVTSGSWGPRTTVRVPRAILAPTTGHEPPTTTAISGARGSGACKPPAGGGL